MSPYDEWLMIRDRYPNRSLNDCLIFITDIKSLPQPTVSLSVDPLVPQILPLSAPTPVVASRPRTLDEYNTARMTSSIACVNGMFAYVMHQLLREDWCPNHDTYSHWVHEGCKAVGFQTVTPQAVFALLSAIGYVEDLQCASEMLYAYLVGDPYPTPRIMTRPVEATVLVICLYLKDRLHNRERNHTGVAAYA